MKIVPKRSKNKENQNNKCRNFY